VRSQLLLAALMLALAGGCGGGKEAEVPTTTSAPPRTATTSADPGRDAIAAFVAAARSSEFDGMWRMLSTPSKARLGPTLARFRNLAAPALARRLRAFRPFRLVVSERTTPDFGVVAIDGGRGVGVYAAALRLEGTAWKLELGGPVVVRPIGPDPGARENVVAQVAAAVEGPGGVGTAVMYVDGNTEQPQVRGTATNSTLFANFEPPLPAGRHIVVVFATSGRQASATAWAFTALK
jgi:hypothetical protein